MNFRQNAPLIGANQQSLGPTRNSVPFFAVVTGPLGLSFSPSTERPSPPIAVVDSNGSSAGSSSRRSLENTTFSFGFQSLLETAELKPSSVSPFRARLTQANLEQCQTALNNEISLNSLSCNLNSQKKNSAPMNAPTRAVTSPVWVAAVEAPPPDSFEEKSFGSRGAPEVARGGNNNLDGSAVDDDEEEERIDDDLEDEEEEAIARSIELSRLWLTGVEESAALKSARAGLLLEAFVLSSSAPLEE
jgi:hypothetical protein